MYLHLSDVCLAILWIDECRPPAWFSRRGFTHARKVLLFLWLLMGSFLLMGYKSTLQSSLITINYEDNIETIYDLGQSGISVAFSEGTVIERILSTDPRNTVKRMYKNAIGWPFAGGHAPRRIFDK